MAQFIVDGLRPQPNCSVGSGLQDHGSDADVEEDYPGRKAPKGGGPKRRNQWENMLSVSPCSLALLPGLDELTPDKHKIRKYMQKLITPAKLTENTVTEQEATTFNPDLGPCCDSANFRVHLEGTTCNAWNKSAINVFVNRFLIAHPEYPSQEESVRDMVRMKSRATLESMIKRYRNVKTPYTDEELRALRLQRNSQERKRKASFIRPAQSSSQ